MLFDVADGLNQGNKLVDSRAAEGSREKVFIVTRRCWKKSSPQCVNLLEGMCKDPGVTRWSDVDVPKRFGAFASKSDTWYNAYLGRCLEGMDGVCALDFPISFWENDFLVDLVKDDSVSLVLVIDIPSEKYDLDDGAFDIDDYMDLYERLPNQPMTAVVVLPEENASEEVWADTGAFLWRVRKQFDGVIVMPPESSKPQSWGGQFLATWMSITSAALHYRFRGHLSMGGPHNICLPFFHEGESP